MEIRHLTYDFIDALLCFAERNNAELYYFRPHPWTREAISHIITNAKQDLYFVVVHDGIIIGYGLLRGVDEGYKNFSLGIAVDKEYYGIGLAKMFMSFLELQAMLLGHSTIRLRAFNDNGRAYTFYKNLGYEYVCYGDYVVGTKKL